MPKYSYIELIEKHVNEFDSFCPRNEYRIIQPANVSQSLLSIVPNGLWEKSDSLFLMSSGSAGATAYCMINCNRWDSQANAIDQEPIFFAHVGGEPQLNGIIVHHGNWPGRTTPVPPEFHPYLMSSGLGKYYPISSIPGTISGSIETLTNTSQHGAFDTGLKKIIRIAEHESDD